MMKDFWDIVDRIPTKRVRLTELLYGSTVPSVENLVAERKTSKVSVIMDDGAERGFWGVFADEESEKTYDRDTTGDVVRMRLLNHDTWFGTPTWGLLVEAVTRGVNRPLVKAPE